MAPVTLMPIFLNSLSAGTTRVCILKILYPRKCKLQETKSSNHLTPNAVEYHNGFN
jgi:hypothetical protein